ncbi:MAG TPA: hypothetical protein VMO75_06570 [Chthoniobacterales bacterium]|nr:hypothetical protein [Chthoniobacterales bacterium]
MEEPDKLRIFIRVRKEDAAMSQLRAAIYLWFHGGNAVSVHTLAAAAHDCFCWMAKHKGKESIHRKWMLTQSKGFQKRVADAQNFFKHGHKWLKGEVKYPPLYGELLMFDSVICYGMVFDSKTMPLPLRLYAVRFGIENGDILEVDLSRFFLERDIIKELAPLSRQQFYEHGVSLLGHVESWMLWPDSQYLESP